MQIIMARCYHNKTNAERLVNSDTLTAAAAVGTLGEVNFGYV